MREVPLNWLGLRRSNKCAAQQLPRTNGSPEPVVRRHNLFAMVPRNAGLLHRMNASFYREPDFTQTELGRERSSTLATPRLAGYLAHKKTPTPLGPT